MTLFILSLMWLLLSLKKGYKEMALPLLYLIIAIATFVFQEFIILKTLPLIISTLITLLILISYVNKQSIIIYFAKKIQKKEFSKEEELYIHNSTLFWFFVSAVNVGIHLSVLLNNNIQFWIYYSSVGWYLVFIVGGIMQFLHRKLVFLKRDIHE